MLEFNGVALGCMIYPIMQRRLTIGVFGAIPPALLDALLPGKGVLRVGCRGNHADLSGAGDAASLPHETPLPEKIGLHVEP